MQSRVISLYEFVIDGHHESITFLID